MNQGNNLNNNVQNTNTTPVTPTPMPNTGTVVTPTPMPATGNVVKPTPVANNVVAPSNTVPQTPVQPIAPAPQTPVGPAPQAPATPVVNPAPVQPTPQVQPTPVVNTVQGPGQQPSPVHVVPQQVNTQNVVAPTENVINTSKKRSGNLFLFIVIILIVLFVYFIDDVLLYFNQNFVPVTEAQVEESGGARLVNGLLQINSNESAYVKVKNIKFHSFKKDSTNKFLISYIADRNFSNPATLNLMIELYNKDKEIIYEEKFSPVGAIEALKLRQYQIQVDSEVYENALYILVKEKTNEGN